VPVLPVKQNPTLLIKGIPGSQRYRGLPRPLGRTDSHGANHDNPLPPEPGKRLQRKRNDNGKVIVRNYAAIAIRQFSYALLCFTREHQITVRRAEALLG